MATTRSFVVHINIVSVNVVHFNLVSNTLELSLLYTFEIVTPWHNFYLELLYEFILCVNILRILMCVWLYAVFCDNCVVYLHVVHFIYIILIADYNANYENVIQNWSLGNRGPFHMHIRSRKCVNVLINIYEFIHPYAPFFIDDIPENVTSIESTKLLVN